MQGTVGVPTSALTHTCQATGQAKGVFSWLLFPQQYKGKAHSRPSHEGPAVDSLICHCSGKHRQCFCPWVFHAICPMFLDVTGRPPGQRWPALPQGGILACLCRLFIKLGLLGLRCENTEQHRCLPWVRALQRLLVIFLCEKRGWLPAVACDPSAVPPMSADEIRAFDFLFRYGPWHETNREMRLKTFRLFQAAEKCHRSKDIRLTKS